MTNDLIFHLVSKRKWKEWQKNGFFRPDTEEEGITCYTADQISDIADVKFKGRKTILMLVIHRQRVLDKILYREFDGVKYPVIQGKINLDAIIDKIRLEPNPEGLFDIEIEEK